MCSFDYDSRRARRPRSSVATRRAARLRPGDRRRPAPVGGRSARRGRRPPRRRQRHPRRPRAPRPPARDRRGRRGAAQSVADDAREALARPSRRLRVGETLAGTEGPSSCSSPRRRQVDPPPRRAARRAALPPYIHERLDDPERYQTVYATETGSAAAPTAGLHFTPELPRAGRARADHAPRRIGHVPAGHGRDARGARAPRRAVSRRGADLAADRRPSGCSPSGRRRPASSRPSRAAGRSRAGPDLFITPGFRFRRVDALLTNFHLPRTTPSRS